MKTRKEMQTDLIRQIVALFPKDWNPQAEDSQEMMMIKIAAELQRAHQIQQDWQNMINKNNNN